LGVSYLLAGLIGPFLWLVGLAVLLWLVRRFFPKWEKILFMKIPNDPPDTPKDRR
jgi:hypothetical protein